MCVFNIQWQYSFKQKVYRFYLWQMIHYLMNLKIKLIHGMQLSTSSYLEEKDISESAELISSVLKENVSELKLQITDFQRDL
jgi:hypothetical protein